MPEFVIEAEPREASTTNAARRLRRAGKLPAVVYGGDQEATPIAVDPRKLLEVLKSESGENTVFQIKVGEKSKPDTVMIFDYQVDPVTHTLIHADLVRIAMDRTIEVEVPIELVGEAKGVKIDGGVLDHTLRDLPVECLPGEIPDELVVDVSALEIGDVIRVADLQVPPGLEVLVEPSQTVVSVVPPMSEEELAPAVEEILAEEEEPELIRPERAEEEGEEIAEEEEPGEAEERETE